MQNLEKEIERKDTEEFVKDILMKVPKGQPREMVLAITGAVAATVSAINKSPKTNLNNGGTAPASP